MDTHRKIALLLHGLNREDGRWILDQLPHRHGDRLAELLTELDELGIPREPLLLAEIEERTATMPDSEDTAPELPAAVRQLLDADAQRVAALLANESDALAGCVLASHDWPWRDAVLAVFGHPRRQAIDTAMSVAARITDSTRQTLLQHLLEGLQAATDEYSLEEEVLAEVSRKPGPRWRLPWRFSWLT